MSIMKECSEVDLLEFLTEATYELDYLLNFQQDTTMINNSLGDGLNFTLNGNYQQQQQQIYNRKLEQRLAEEHWRWNEEQMIFRFQEQQRLKEEQNRLQHQILHQQLNRQPTPAPLYRDQPLMPPYASGILSYSGSQFDEVMIEYMPVYNQINHSISGSSTTFKPQPTPPYIKQIDPARHHQREALQNHQHQLHHQQQVYTNFQMNQTGHYNSSANILYNNQIEGYQESSNQPILGAISGSYYNRPKSMNHLQISYVLSDKTTSTTDQIT